VSARIQRIAPNIRWLAPKIEFVFGPVPFNGSDFAATFQRGLEYAALSPDIAQADFLKVKKNTSHAHNIIEEEW